MKKFARLFQQAEFALLLFILCLILFNWQFLGLPGQAQGYAAYVYLFLAWAVVILILFLMDRANKMPEQGKAGEKEDRGV